MQDVLSFFYKKSPKKLKVDVRKQKTNLTKWLKARKKEEQQHENEKESYATRANFLRGGGINWMWS